MRKIEDDDNNNDHDDEEIFIQRFLSMNSFLKFISDGKLNHDKEER